MQPDGSLNKELSLPCINARQGLLAFKPYLKGQLQTLSINWATLKKNKVAAVVKSSEVYLGLT